MNLFVYIVVAFTFSVYYGIRGIFIQRISAAQQNFEIEEKKGRMWSQFEKVFVRYIQDFIFNFVCSAAGFLALSVTYQIYSKIEDITKIETGTAILLAFLFLLGIAGISGQLPFLLLQGRFPGAKQ